MAGLVVPSAVAKLTETAPSLPPVRLTVKVAVVVPASPSFTESVAGEIDKVPAAEGSSSSVIVTLETEVPSPAPPACATQRDGEGFVGLVNGVADDRHCKCLGGSIAVGEGHRATVGGVIGSGRGRVGRAVGRCEVDRNSSVAAARSAHREGRRRRPRISFVHRKRCR